MAVLSENWGELLEPGLRKIFYDTFNDYPSQIPTLFNVQTSSKAAEHDLDTGTLSDVPEFEGTIEYDEPNIELITELYAKTSLIAFSTDYVKMERMQQCANLQERLLN